MKIKKSLSNIKPPENYARRNFLAFILFWFLSLLTYFLFKKEDRLYNQFAKLIPLDDSKLRSDAINVKNPPHPLVAAKGDGVTNDQVAIQNIIKYAENMGISQVYVPEGTYLIYGFESGYYSSVHPASLVFTKATSFIGAGMNETNFDFRNLDGNVPHRVMYAGETCSFISYQCDNQLKGFKVTGFSVEGGWRNLSVTEVNNHKFCNFEVGANDPENVIFEDLKITGFGGEGIHSPMEHKKALVKQCIFQFVNGSSGNIAGQVTYEKCHFKNLTQAIECGVSPNNTNGYLKVINCVFKNATKNGSAISAINNWERVVENGTNYVHDQELRGTMVEIKNNLFHGTDDTWMEEHYSSITIREIENVFVEGNTFYDYGVGDVYGASCIGYLSQVRTLSVLNNRFIRNRRDEEPRFFNMFTYKGKPGVDKILMLGNRFLNAETLPREKMTFFFPVGSKMFPSQLVMRGNQNSATLKDIAVGEENVELADLGPLITAGKARYRVTYKFKSSTDGFAFIYLYDGLGNNIDIGIEGPIVAAEGLKGAIEIEFNNPELVTNVWVRGQFNGGKGGRLNIKVEMLDLEYSA